MTLIVSTLGDMYSGGGLFAVEGSQVERLDRISTTGVAFDGRRLARVLRCLADQEQLTEIAIYDARGVLRYMRLDKAPACHDIAWDGEDLVAVASWDNAVRWFSPAGDVVREVVYPGQINSYHLNCVIRHEGTWYATLFGEFRTFRAFTLPARSGQGKLVNLETGETIVSGLTAPHSPRWVDGMWLVCNSEERELRAIDAASGQIVRRVDCGYWTRGLTYDDSFFYVGGCQRRGAGGQSFGDAKVMVIDRATWKPVEQISIPAQEIYDLQFVPPEFTDGIRRGFDVNPTRTSEFRQYRILTELGNDQPRTLWPSGDPLPWGDFRCELACQLPVAAKCGDLFELPSRVTNRSASFFTNAQPAPIFLSYKWLNPQTGEYLDDNRAYRSPLPRTIFPGETVEMIARIVVPDRPGPAILRLTLIQEGISWFDEQDASSGIEQTLVIAPAPSEPREAPRVTSMRVHKSAGLPSG
jgi:Domain of unknown function (DUF4915)